MTVISCTRRPLSVRYDLETLEPRVLLCGDLHAWLDPAEPSGDAVAAESVDVVPVPPYSSRPSASKKIYIDFNGHPAISNWGGWAFGGKDVPATNAYDIDGDPWTFSAQERANIERIWKGVAEKFSPWDVDVTTIAPSSLNGVQVVVGGDGTWYGGRASGVAIRGYFGTETFIDPVKGNVAFVWGSPGNPDRVAETVAHEAGHTLGLNHQSVQPVQQNEYAKGFIMGGGRNTFQPWHGRWANSAVQGTVATYRDGDTVKTAGSQNDALVIGGKLSLRPDDHGNSVSTPTPLPLTFSGGFYIGAASGVIEWDLDRDTFRINHNGGSIDIEVLAAEVTPMLNPQMMLLNSAGELLVPSSVNNGADGLGERIQLNNLNAGTYHIQIRATASWDDFGQYRLNVRAGVGSASPSNDTLATATPIGVFGRTELHWVTLGLSGTAIINDSLATNDNYDYFRFRTPLHTRQLYVGLSGKTVAASLAVYDDLNGNGIVDTGEILFATNPSLSSESFMHSQAVAGKTYYVRVARDPGGAAAGNYTLRISTDAAPQALPPSVAAAAFDPQPLVGGRFAYNSIDQLANDQVDYYRVTAEVDGLFSFYMSDTTADLRLDVGVDGNGDGLLQSGEIIATAATPNWGNEFLQNVPAAAGQQLLVRVQQQAPGASSNYSLLAVADYAGGNTAGSLIGARDLTGKAAGLFYEYLDSSVDFHDVFKIAPPPGPLDVALLMLSDGISHRVEIIRDSNGNGQIDPGEVVASGFTEGQSHNVTAGADYYIRVSSFLWGESMSVGNYGLAYITAGALTGKTLDLPTPVDPTPILKSVNGYLGFHPIFLALTDIEDYFQFTLGSRTRFDASITGAGIGVQVGKLDGEGNFQRIGGVGRFQGTNQSLSVNLDPGTYLLRAYLFIEEQQDEPSGDNYTLSFKTAAITDNTPPQVTAASFQYEIGPHGVIFTVSEDVFGSIEAANVVIRHLETNTIYPVGQTFYDPATRRIGYAAADGVLPDGNYRATLLAGSIRDAAANPLAADYSIDFFVLAGDANRDRIVNIADLGILAANWQQNGTFSQGNFNYDTLVNIADLGILAANWQKTMPPAMADDDSGAALPAGQQIVRQAPRPVPAMPAFALGDSATDRLLPGPLQSAWGIIEAGDEDVLTRPNPVRTR